MPAPGDLRRDVTINTDLMASPKFPQTGGPDHDWIELRLADVILLYAETLNETGASAEVALDAIDPIRTRAGVAPLDHTVLNTQALVRQAIQDERRLELAFEGQRWFDLVRTETVNEEMGESIDSRYHLFPVPISEVLASFGVITQNEGYISNKCNRGMIDYFPYYRFSMWNSIWPKIFLSLKLYRFMVALKYPQ